MHNEILIRFGELSLKGKNKDLFIKKLAENFKTLLNITPEKHFDRFFIPYSQKNLNKLKFIFGITSFSPVYKVPSTKKEIINKVLQIAKKRKFSSFKINVIRHDKSFEDSSINFSAEIGSHVLKNIKEIKVKMKEPEIQFEVEIRKKYSYIFTERISGLGGLPVGVSGKVLHLISGGIDSPVAAFKLMKRGFKVDFINFTTPPHTDKEIEIKVKKLITLLNKYQGGSKLFKCNFTNLMQLFSLTENPKYKIILMRRSFYRIASKIARERNYVALGNGENIGQVASQTPESLNVITYKNDVLILRPLLTNDKIETIRIAKEIGTFDISIIKAKETCELFAPKNPIIKPKISSALELEQNLDELKKLEDETLKKIKVITIK